MKIRRAVVGILPNPLHEKKMKAHKKRGEGATPIPVITACPEALESTGV